MSFMSYNTKAFLIKKLNEMQSKDIINFWLAIEHKAESNETKNHFHCYIEPNDEIDINKFKNEFNEIDINNIKKPLSIVFSKKNTFSNFDNFYMYCLHNPEYIKRMTKEKTKQYQYTREEFITSSDEVFSQYIGEIDYNKLYRKSKVVDYLRELKTPFQALEDGIIELKDTSAYSKQYEQLIKETNAKNLVQQSEQELLALQGRKIELEEEIQKLVVQCELAGSRLKEYNQMLFEKDLQLRRVKNNEELPF